MTRRRADVLSLVFIAIVVAVAAWLYPDLPDPVPTHWNAEGEVNGYMAKPWGVVIPPLIAVGILLLMWVIPVISPKGFRIDTFANAFNIFQVTLVGIVCYFALLALLAAAGLDVRMNQTVFGGLGLLFIFLGNYFGKVRKNFFLGIRTPWTLASEEVWGRTHRLGARLMVLIGIIFFAGVFFPLAIELIFGLIILLVLAPVVYSYFVYRRVEGFDEGP